MTSPRYEAIGNAIVDELLDLVDREPPDLRDRINAAIRDGRHRAYLQPNGDVVVTFEGIDPREVHYVIPTVRRHAGDGAN